MSDATWGFVFIFLLYQFGALIGLSLRRNDIADVLWGPGFIVGALGAWFGARRADGSAAFGPTSLLIFILVSLWGLRLAWHIGRRFFKKPGEDARYREWRRQWGDSWIWRSYLQIFILQPLLLGLIALPVLHAMTSQEQTLGVTSWLGAALWMFGFIFEAVADSQLAAFTANPANKGRLMTRGLWSWSRHPNYFGEVTLWWGIWLISFSVSAWWLILSPLLISFLILKVSGVSLTEEMMAGRPGFDEYRKNTSVFFPWPPKKNPA